MSSSGTFLQPRFFVTGGTLPRDAACYIRREADERLYSSLRRSDICYALTPRQMGKSSLMVQTGARLRDKGISVALLDLTAFGQNLTPDQWYSGLVDRIGHQLDLEDELESYWNSHLHLGPLQRWTGAIREVVLELRSGPVVIFIDEIDAVRSLRFSTDEFFAGIREFYNRRSEDAELNRLTFCLLGVATPSDLIRDTRTTPFNIGVRVELSDFTAEEAAPLAQGLCTDAEKGQQLIRRVLYWTGGHPYLTQRLCQAVSGNSAATPADVDRACSELFLSHRAREKDDNLLFVRERMLRNETDLAGLLLLYGKVQIGARVRDDETNPLVSVLRLAGIVRVDNGNLSVRNRIYAEVFNKEWVSENMPGAEVRRQRAAYFRGFRIAGTVFVPLALLGAYGVYQYEFKTNTTPPASVDLKPPAFWASFTPEALPAAESGALLIRAADADVSVFVNGAQYGRTERDGVLQIPVLPAGDYEVRLEKPGFQTVSGRAQVVAQRETRLSFALSPTSQVAIDNLLLISQAPPGTRVGVDGKTAGTTNTEGELSVKIVPGEHEIALDKAGYLPRSLKARLISGSNVIDGKLLLDREAVDRESALRSMDIAKLQEFLKDYPDSKSADLVRAKLEDLEWSRYRDSNDPNQLQVFIDRYPNGQHIADARHLEDQLVAEDIAWRSAVEGGHPELLQGFVAKYPHSRHVADAQSTITLMKDRAEILQVIQAYQDSYNRRDLKQLLQLWPNCPVLLQSSVKDKKSGTISLSARGTPVVKGEIASLMVAITKQTGTGDSEKTVPFRFKKQNDLWVIDTGSF